MSLLREYDVRSLETEISVHLPVIKLLQIMKRTTIIKHLSYSYLTDLDYNQEMIRMLS